MIKFVRALTIGVALQSAACDRSRLVVHENPLDGTIGQIARGDTAIKFFGLSESPDQHVLDFVELSNSKGKVRYVKLDEQRRVTDVFDNSGTHVELGWNDLATVVDVSISYYLNGELIKDKTQIDAGNVSASHSETTESLNDRLLKIDTKIEACINGPTLNDIRRVQIAADYGLGTQSWFPRRVQDDLYSTTVNVDAEWLRRNRRNQLAVRNLFFSATEAICAAVDLFSPNQAERLCALLSFSNPNTAAMCGILLSPVQSIACIGAETFQMETIKMIEEDLEKIDGSLWAAPTAVYIAPSGTFKSATGEKRYYKPGPPEFVLDVALPCGAGTFVGSFSRDATLPGRGPAENCIGQIAAKGTIMIEFANVIRTSGDLSYLHDFDCFDDDQSPDQFALLDLLHSTMDEGQVSTTGHLSCPDGSFSGVTWKLSSVPSGDAVSGNVTICGTNILHEPFVVPFEAVLVP